MTLTLHRRLAGEPVRIHTPETATDALTFLEWASDKPRLGLDTETTGREIYHRDFRVRMAQFGTSDEAWCIPVGEGLDWAIKRVLDSSKRFVLHNSSFDVVSLDRHGLADGRELINRCEDSYITAHLADPRDRKSGGTGHKLKDQVREFIDPDYAEDDDLKLAFRESGARTLADGWRKIDTMHPAYLTYAGLDPMLAWRLDEIHAPTVRRTKQEHLIPFEHRLQQITTRMILRGLLIDVGYTEQLSQDLGDEAEYWAYVALRDHGVENVQSSAQVAESLIADGWKPEVFTEKSGDPKLDDKTLEALAEHGYPLAKAVVLHKRAAKFKGTYADSMLELRDGNDRIHPMIAPLRARTARMSSSSPNFQNLPSNDPLIRFCVLADPGYSIVSVDYSQVEMRVLAALSKEPTMLEQIRNGRKVHDVVATQMFGDSYTKDQYKLAKNTGFGEVFGGGAKTLAEQAGVNLEVAREAKKIFSEGFPGIKSYGRWLMNLAKADNYNVRNAFGRLLPVDPDRLYSATNYVVQSSARDLFGHDLIAMSEAGLEEYLMLPVHDEMLAQAPENEAKDLAREIEDIMSHEDWRGVPIAAEADIYGRSWGEGYVK